MPSNQIRIIGGQWRSRQISFNEAPGLRPTPNRVRETLFNWLQHDIPGSRCLDLFAGSGALGFEAASRGAKFVVQVEADHDACKSLQDNAAKLKASQITTIENDVLHFLVGHPEPFDIVFLDPPFGQNLVKQCCQLLEEKHWLTIGAKIYLETESKADALVGVPGTWQLLKRKTAGEVAYQLFLKHE